MGLRKATAYSKKKVTPNTRISKKKSKSYVKVVPPQKIVKFTMGKEGAFEKGKIPYVLTVVTKEKKLQIRDHALEACRQFLNKKLDKETGGVFMLRVVPFPHHIQRENKMLTGAGADRMQTGMQLSFGKSAGKAAILKKGQKIFVIAVPTKKNLSFARKIIQQVKSKLPGKISVLYEEIKK